MPPLVTVVLPVHDRESFIARALDSLLAQTCEDWELRIVDDASTDGTVACLDPYLADPRVSLRRLPVNGGLGAALNVGLADARGTFVAYLPSDDVWYRDHLASLVDTLRTDPGAVVAFSGVRHHYNRESTVPLDEGLQLVQIAHRPVAGFRWRERHELVTDSLAWMGLDDLAGHGRFVPTGRVTCEWVDHPDQLSKLVREPVGGIARYRRRYRVAQPMLYHTTVGDRIDERVRYARYRDPDRQPRRDPDPNPLRILLVGELAYNADRILALEEAGHRLFGLWMDDPHWYNTVGPLPFGRVTNANSGDPAEAIRETRPDVIYALLNWQAVPFAARVLRANPGVPFVWHFKEGPFISLERGHWPDLAELTARADGVVHTSEEMREWFGTAVPGADDPARSLVLDGDLPKADWFDVPLPPPLERADGAIHTVVPGRPIGLHPDDVASLAALDIHLHFYGDFTQGQWRAWIDRSRGLAPRHLHLHPAVGQERWVEELGQYDAGWLHVFRSRNDGDLRRADWDDLNVPARMATLSAAGLPMLQPANTGHRVATQALLERMGIGVLFDGWDDLGERLRDGSTLAAARRHMEGARSAFTFDAHVDRLVDFFRSAIDRSAGRRDTGVAGTAPPPLGDPPRRP